MSNDIDLLWTLCGLDDQLVALNAELKRFPAQRAAIEQRLAAERARLEQAKARFAELQKSRRAIEQEIAAVTETERKYKGQQAAVKKNEEFKALQHEIEGAQNRRSELETGVLQKLEDEDREQAGRPALERALATAEKESAEGLAKIGAEERADRERVAALEAERQTHVAGLSPQLRTRYERIRGGTEGRALVSIVKGSCGACYRGQPPQVVQEARKRDRVLICDGCGRMLLWPPESV